MTSQQRPAAELMLVGKLLGEEKQLVLALWQERLKDLPLPPERPLAQRLTVRADGLLALDLRQTKVADLAPLRGMPLGRLDCSGSREIIDLDPLRDMPLRELRLEATGIYQIAPIASLRQLEELSLAQTRVTNLDPLRGLPLRILDLGQLEMPDLDALAGLRLEELDLSGGRVTELAPLHGMPLRRLTLDGVAAADLSPLEGMPLESLSLRSNLLGDLSFVRNAPLKELFLGPASAENLRTAAQLPALETLLLPRDFIARDEGSAEAVAELKKHRALRQVGIETGNARSDLQGSAEFWREWEQKAELLRQLLALDSDIKAKIVVLPDRTWGVTVENSRRTSSSPVQALDFLREAPITKLLIENVRLKDLNSLRGLPLRLLGVRETPISDLGPLAGMPLEELEIGKTEVTDLSPLRGLRLKRLCLEGTAVADLSPLRGMPLEDLWLGGTKIADLTALQAMPLRALHLDECVNIVSLSPLLAITTLEQLRLPPNAEVIEQLKTLPRLRFLSFEYDGRARRPRHSVEEFWNRGSDGHEQALTLHQRFAEAEQQIRRRIKDGQSVDRPLDDFRLAVLALARGDRAAYREVCAETRRRFCPENAARTLLVCTLADDSGISPEDLQPMIAAASAQLSRPGWHMERLACALAAYRVGGISEARRLMALLFSDLNTPYRFVIAGRAIEALAWGKTGDSEHRRGACDEAAAAIRRMKSGAQDPGYWQDWLFAELLTIEAEALIGKATEENRMK